MPWGFAAAGIASGVAGAAASSAGGKKGSAQSRQSAAVSAQQVALAKQAQEVALEQLRRTQPLRDSVNSRLSHFASTGEMPGWLDLPSQVSPTAQLASLSLPQIQAQQAQQRQQLLNAGVRGGALTQGLGQAAIQSGLQYTNTLQGLQLDDILRQDARDVQRVGIRQSLFGAAADAGTGGMTQAQQGFGQAMAGYGNAAGNFNSLGAQRIGQNMQTQQALGSLAGKGLGYAGGQMLPGYSQGSLGAQKYGGGGLAGNVGGAAMRNTGANYGPGF